MGLMVCVCNFNSRSYLLRENAVNRGVFFLIWVVIGIVGSSANAGQLLYGVTETNLVSIDSLDPTSVNVIGAHGLSTGLIPFSLAYDPINDVLLGVTTSSPSPFTRRLIQYDRITGQATVLATLGDINSNFVEAVEYVDSRSGFVAGFATSGANAIQVRDISLDGSTSPIVTTALDNDGAVYDSQRDVFYTIDPNGPAQLAQVSLSTGSHVNRGALPSGASFALAYSSELDAIFNRAGGNLNQLWRADAADAAGGTSVTFTNVGVIEGDLIRGLAFAPNPVPEPSSIVLLGLGGVVLLGCGWRRKRKKDLSVTADDC